MNSRTGEFLAMRPNGEIATFFRRLSDPAKYWSEQILNMGNKNEHGKQKCACCRYFTISEIKETCPVCFWEEDFYQEEHIDDNGGPNLVSLREAQENFKSFGAIEMRFVNFARPPKKDEMNE